jgi:methylated-DNA-[protein]-cysteine S-methyltransferase
MIISAVPAVSVFSTPLGWMGLIGFEDELFSAFVGHSSAKSVTAAASKLSDNLSNSDWNPTLRGMFEAYAEGDVIDFGGVKIHLPEMTEFRRKIIAATRRLAYGETATYGELAKRVGNPGAARAVGTVMSTNRFPIVVPCHRVLASGGKLGGFSAPAGLGLKQQMLDLEGRGRFTR